jgi:hypothetical protein
MAKLNLPLNLDAYGSSWILDCEKTLPAFKAQPAKLEITPEIRAKEQFQKEQKRPF